MNMDEKAKLVTNDSFHMISDERNSSRMNLNQQPDRTLSSFLFESQFYENLQIVRCVAKVYCWWFGFKLQSQLSACSLACPRKQPDHRPEILPGEEEIYPEVNYWQLCV